MSESYVVNKKNLQTLKDNLYKIPRDRFDMRRIHKKELSVQHCDTSCCLLGWAPYLHPILSINESDKSWEEYSYRVFFNTTVRHSTRKINSIWVFLFSAYHENNLSLAARRIDHVLKYGEYIESKWDPEITEES